MLRLTHTVDGEAILKIERRWMDADLPETEILEALCHCYLILRKLLCEAHNELHGTIPPNCAFLENATKTNKELPELMEQAHQPRISWIRLADGATVSIQQTSQMFTRKDIEETKTRNRYGFHEKIAQALKDAKNFRDVCVAWFQHSKRMLEVDGYLIPTAIIHTEKSVHIHQLRMQDRADKHMVLRHVADICKRLDAVSVMITLAELIREPSRENFSKFSSAWELLRQKLGARANPLLINRTVAACTMNVSSTVNGPAFDRVYWWLVAEGILERLPDPAAGWYDRNLQVMDMLRSVFADELAKSETSEQLLSMFVWYLFENITNPLTLKQQVIKYGAPGTGKTYTAMQSTNLLFDIWREKYQDVTPELTHQQCVKVVQFHPSYGYEDFIEGLRPTLKDGQSQLTLQNGVFKEFCRRAGAWEIEVHRLPEIGPALAKNWLELTVGELKTHIGKNLSLPLWEGIGKLADSQKVAEAVPPFFFIVDEINRAELSRVLGELMLAIEYRGVNGCISTQYAQLNTPETAMLTTSAGHCFFIPHNVYFIGTMNTIDRSVESFDLALRRRFRWERIDPDIDALRLHLEKRDAEPGNKSQPWAGLAADLERLNESIRQEEILGEDYQIGHAYLMNLRYPPTLTVTELRRRVWEDSLRPLLEEYLRGSDKGKTLIPQFQKAFGIT